MWLNTTPEKAGLTRSLMLQADGNLPDIPDIYPFEWIIDHLLEMGGMLATGNGAVPLTFTEISAWSAITKTPISRHIAIMLKKLSIEYVQQSNVSSDPKCPQPKAFIEEDVTSKSANKALEDKLDMLF